MTFLTDVVFPVVLGVIGGVFAMVLGVSGRAGRLIADRILASRHAKFDAQLKVTG